MPIGVGVKVEVSVAISVLGGVAGHLQKEFWIAGLGIAAQLDLEHCPTEVPTHSSWLAILFVKPRDYSTAKLVHEQDHSVDGEQI